MDWNWILKGYIVAWEMLHALSTEHIGYLDMIQEYDGQQSFIM
jgi:hypothetical protein